MNFKALFSSPKKTAAVVACLLAVAAAVGIGIGYVARGNAGFSDGSAAIGGENAQKFAFADAGVDPALAQAVRVTYERFEGEFVYSVEFIAENTQYIYKINAGDGSVVKKESRTALPDGTAPLPAAVTLEEALEIALEDAGVSREDAIFSRAEAETEGGRSVYSFRFYAANVEYEYQINAATGAVYSKKTVTYMGHAPVTESREPARTDAPTVPPGPTAEPTQPPAATQPGPAQSEAPSAPQSTDRPSGMYIGMSAAKRAALDHAKVSAGEARFTQVRMDYEDGAAVYVLEFYTSTHAYKYRLNAKTGAVLGREKTERSD